MALQFPPSPNLNQTYVSGTRSWKWNGYAWDAVLSVVAPSSGINVGVSGGDLISNPPNVIFGSDTEVLNVNIEGDGLGGAKLIHSITGETGTTLEHDLPGNHFSNLSGDTDGYGRQFLVLKDDGDVGFEYIKVQDVFKNSDFVFDISSLKLGTSNDFTTSKSTLIGTNSAGTTLANLGSEFKVTYAGSPSPQPVSAKISSSSFVGTTEYDLSDPYTTLSTNNLFVSYPAQSDNSINIKVTGTGSDGVSDSSNFSLKFPNNAYFGSGEFGIDGSGLSSSGFTAELKTSSNLSSPGVTVFYDVPPNEFAYFAYPTSRGTTITVSEFQGEGLPTIPVTEYFNVTSNQSHTNELGFTENYQIVTSAQSSLGSVAYIFIVS
jgi:hypothetical protein